MKVSYRNMPILERIERGSMGKVSIPKTHEWYSMLLRPLNDVFVSNIDAFKSEINVISRPFATAVNSSIEKLSTIYDDIKQPDGKCSVADMLAVLNTDDISGTIIYDREAYLYRISATRIIFIETYYDPPF